MVSTSFKVISIPKLCTSSPGYPCKDQMVYRRRVQSLHPAWWYTIKSHLQLWYVMVSFVSLSLKMGKLIFVWAPVSLCHLPHWECWEPSDLSDCDDTDEAVDMELQMLSNPQSGEGEGDQVVSASGPFHIDCSPSLSAASGVMVDGQNWHCWGGLFGENHLDGRIWIVAASKDASMVSPALLPLSGILWSPGQLFIGLLV